MPKGEHISGDIRRIIARFYRQRKTAKETWETLFQREQPNDNDIISLSNLRNIFTMLRQDINGAAMRIFESDLVSNEGSVSSITDVSYIQSSL